MANENKDLRFRVLAQVVGSEAISELNQKVSSLGNTATGIKGKFDSLASGIRGLAGAFVIQQAVQFTKSLIDTGDELLALSEKTGVAVKDLSGFKAAAEMGNLPFENLSKVLKKFSANIAEASTGNKDLIADFKAVGISFKDQEGNIRGTGDVVKDVADKFSQMKDGPEKAALAMRLFGKSGADIIPFLNQGSTALTEFGLAIDDDLARRMDLFNDTLTLLGNQAKNNVLGGLTTMLPAIQEIANAMKEVPQDTKVSSQAFMELGEVLRLGAVAGNIFLNGVQDIADFTSTVLAQAIRGAINLWGVFSDATIGATASILAAAKGNFSQAKEIGLQTGTKIKEGLQLSLDDNSKIFNQFFDRYMARSKAAGDFNDKLMKNSLLFGEGTMAEILKRQREETQPEVKNKDLNPDLSEIAKNRKVERDRVKEFIDQQKLENAQRREALGDINLTALELRKVTEARRLDAEAIKTSKTMTAEQRTELLAATEVLKAQREEIIELEYQQRRTFTFGAKEYLRDYLNEVTNNANAVKQVFSTAFRSLEDTMVSFMKTGKLNFRKFADDVINELLRIAVRQAVIAPIAGAFSNALAGAAGGAAAGGGASSGGSATSSAGTQFGGSASFGQYQFANGGIMTSMGSVPLRKYARGGIANTAQAAIFGEGSTPEAYVPLPDGRSIPVNMKGAGGGVQVNMTINIDKGGSDNSSVASDQESGKAFGNLMKNVALKTILEQKRPGGMLA
jgi:lambda family phage tail tape measure protein